MDPWLKQSWRHAQAAWNESVLNSQLGMGGREEQPASRSFRQRRQVLGARLLDALLMHAMAWCLLAYAASQSMLSWTAVVLMASGSVVAYAAMVAMQRTGTPRHRFDPALFGPVSVLSTAMVAGAAVLSSWGDRPVLIAALLPLELLAAVHVRGRRWRWGAAAACYTGSSALLVWGSHSQPDLGLVCALAALMLAPFLALGALGKLRTLSRRALLCWLMSDDKAAHTYLGRFLVGLVNSLVALAALNYGASEGEIDADAARWISIAAGISSAILYMAMRSGWSKRLRDPGMSESLIVHLLCYLAVSYYLAGIGRGIVMMLVVTVQMYGMYAITPLQVARTSAIAALLLGGSMFIVAREATNPHMVRLQIVQFIVMVMILASMAWLARQLARLRTALVKRKNELADALERIQVLATHDDLTGLINRRHMLEVLQAQAKRHQRTGQPFCVAVVDVDHFKRVNDTHGHGVGDDVLKAFAAGIRSGLRDTDVVARWGGEEFLLMLADTSLEAARLTIERARLQVAGAAMSKAVPELGVTFSCGLTEYHAGESMETTIERADHALYAAKARGRNRTIMRTVLKEADGGGGGRGAAA